MSNGADSHSHVSRIDQRYDNTVEVHVQTDSFTGGQEVEVSCYLIQGDTYVAFNDKKHIPLSDPDDSEKPAVIQVQLPATELKTDQPVTVVTRVSEAWPTILEPNSGITDKYTGLGGPKAVWTAEYPLGKGQGDTAPPASDNGSGEVTTAPA